MTTEFEAIKGIIIDEYFLTDQNQTYRQQVLNLIAEAHSKNIPVIIRFVSNQNENKVSSWLIKKDMQKQATAANKKTLNALLFGFKLNLSECLHISHEKSELYKDTKHKINYTLIQSPQNFAELVVKVQQQKIRSPNSEFEISLLSEDTDSSTLLTPRDEATFENGVNEESSSCCSPGRWGIFGGGITGLVIGGGAGYLLWPIVKGYLPAGEMAEIGIKLAFAVVLAVGGSGLGYGVGERISKSDCYLSTEASSKLIY